MSKWIYFVWSEQSPSERVANERHWARQREGDREWENELTQRRTMSSRYGEQN